MLFSLKDVYKSYSGIEVLRGVSFQINPGEKVGLVGRNGAGKTTVFRLVAGEEQPDEGTIETINRLKIGLLRQHVDFSEDETVHTAALAAFKELHDIEAEMRRLEVEMAHSATDDVLNRYAELQTRFEREGGFEYVARAESVLLGLNFSKEDWTLRTSMLSGGQKNRLGMVRLLLSDSDILLLDEPTNHLDVATVEWLEQYLRDFDSSYVIVSHDRYFLDKSCSRIIEIENGKAFSYKGGYSKYALESKLVKEQLQREYENEQAYISKTEAFIRKNLAGQKTKQAKSRRNQLQRMDRKEAVTTEQKQSNFGLGAVERTGANVLTVKDLSVGYPGTVLAEGLEFTLLRGESLGIIGGNGSGKSTFLKTVLGQLRELSGSILWGTKVNTGYYSQELETLNPSNDIMAEIRQVAPSAENGQLRSFLAAFLFIGEDVFKTVGDLSGGEKGRLALAKLIYSRSNVLILDEPTNHLDILSREALEQALDEFEGTIITVSHDRYFLDRIATRIFAFHDDTRVDDYNGNYTQYHDWKELQVKTESPVVNNKPDEAVRQTQSAEVFLLSKNEIKRLESGASELESKISAAEDRLKDISQELSLPDVIRDAERFKRVTSEYNSLESGIAQLYKDWEELLEKLQTQA